MLVVSVAGKWLIPRDMVMKKILAFLAAGLFTQQVMAGLLLSHATVERYGGRIELRNVSGGGAEATLLLPRTAGDREAA